MGLIIIVIKYFLVAWVVGGITETLSQFIESDKLVPSLLKVAMSCNKCVAFWLTLIMSQDIYIAALTSFMMYYYDNYLTDTKL